MPLHAVRRAQEADIPWLVCQEQRPDFAAFVHRWPVEQHVRNLHDADKVYLIAEDENGERMAFVILAGFCSADRNVELVRMAVTQPGLGIGKPLLMAVLDMAFGELNVDRLWLDVFEDNVRARRAYEAIGFREEEMPRQPALKSDGQPGSLVIMSILAARYRAMNASH
jgi:diamine N-acetyltransferase